jgi:hypothetical protein
VVGFDGTSESLRGSQWLVSSQANLLDETVPLSMATVNTKNVGEFSK